MSCLPHDCDADEREAFEGLEIELVEARRRHRADPSLALLRAAAEHALPPDLQDSVERYLHASAWSRAIVDGFHDTGTDVHLDPFSVERLFLRIRSIAR